MRLLTRALLFWGRAFQLASTTLHSSAAATLTLAELRNNVVTRWQTFNDQPYDVDSGLIPWETDVADHLVRPGDSALIIGCGSGREIVAYLARGCRVTGMDPAPRVLGIARTLLAERGLTAELIEGFVDEAEVPGRFDIVLFGWWCYCQIPESSRRIRTLRRLAANLEPGGRIALNFDMLLRPRPIVIQLARITGAIARSDWRLEPGDVVEWRHHGGAPFFGYSHAFVPEEIEQEAAAAGLRITYRRDPPNAPAYILEPIS